MAGRPWCLYYIQGEEGETLDEPNAFQVPVSSSSLTLKQLLATFPLEKGAAWHFRFRVKDDKYGYAWQDVRDANASVPVTNGVIFAKVLRLDRPPKPQSRLRRKPLLGQQPSGQSVKGRSSFSSNSSPAAPPTAAPPMTRRPSAGSLPGNAAPERVASPSEARPGTSPPQQPRSGPPPPTRPGPPAPSSSSSPGPSNSSGNTSTFLDTSGASAPPPPPKPATATPPPPVPPTAANGGGGDDLDSFLYGAAGSNGQPSVSIPPPRAGPPPSGPAKTPPPGRVTPTNPATSPNGFMGMDDGPGRRSSAPAAVPAKAGGGGGGAGFVGMDIDEDTPRKASAGGSPNKGLFGDFMESAKSPQTVAKEEKEAKEEEALDAVKARIGPKLEQWANDPSTSKLRNVRTLLSTMHSVLWEGSNWKPLFLGDLMAPDRVKFHYRKAMLLLHPDKNVNGSVEQRFIAERVFTCVNDAYQGFAATELK